MNLKMTIDWDLTDADPGVEEQLEEIVAEEARGFIENIRQRLAAAGVTDINMKLTESSD